MIVLNKVLNTDSGDIPEESLKEAKGKSFQTPFFIYQIRV